MALTIVCCTCITLLYAGHTPFEVFYGRISNTELHFMAKTEADTMGVEPSLCENNAVQS